MPPRNAFVENEERCTERSEAAKAKQIKVALE
jgi:hypothetical protein